MTETVQDHERAVLGGILHDSRVIDDVALILPDQVYFTDPFHRQVYDVMSMLSVNESPIDITSVAGRIRDGNVRVLSPQYNGKASSVVALLDGFLNTVAVTANIPYHAQRVAEHYRLTKLRNGLKSIAANPEFAEEDAVEATESLLMSLDAPVQTEVVRLADFGPQYIDSVLHPDPEAPARVIGTRIQDLNDRLGGGFHRKDVTVIGAPPSMLKTGMAIDYCLFNHRRCVSLFFSLDQSNESLAFRVLANEHGVTQQQFQSERRGQTAYDVIKLAGRDQVKYENFYMIDKPGLTPLDVRSFGRRLKRKRGLDIVVIDYIDRMHWPERVENETQRVTQISGALKVLAKELDVVMLVLSQFSREYKYVRINPDKGNYGRPTMTMLRGSGAIEQDANVVILPWLPVKAVAKHKDYGENSTAYQQIVGVTTENGLHIPGAKADLLTYAELYLDKNKDGETVLVPARWDIERMRFYSEAPPGIRS